MVYKTLFCGILLGCFKTGFALLPVQDSSVDFQRAMCSQDENGTIDCQPVKKSDSNTGTESVWPPGPYAIPMSIYGCPESHEKGWREGYLTMTWTESVEVFIYNGTTQTNRFNSDWLHQAEKINKSVWPSHQTFTLGPFNEFIFKLNFCFKVRNNSSLDKGVWPTGSYGLYADETGCPSGFSESLQNITVPAIRSWTVDGLYPDLQIEKGQTSAMLILKTCTKQSDTSGESSSFSILDTPFVFLGKAGTSCQLFENTGHTFDEETLLFGIPSNTPTKSTLNEIQSFCYSGPKSWDPVDDNLEDLYEERVEKAYYLIPETVLSGNTSIHTSTKTSDHAGDTPSDAHIFFDKVVMEFKNKRSLPWLMIDLGRTISVTALQITPVKDESAELHCFISNERWAFLYFASVICPKVSRYTPYDNRMDILLRRATDGRYIALVRERTSANNKTEPITSSTESVRVYTNRLDQSEVSCNMYLGMSDGSIEESQIIVSSQEAQYNSSSVRPYHPGWCAFIQDPRPTVMVDLKKALRVEGLVVWSWSEKLMVQGDSANIEKLYLLGTRSFKILHGLDADNLLTYNAVFQFDKSRSYSEEQTFFLKDPVNARFIQIYILEPFTDGFNCIKFELIGCSSSELFQNPLLYTEHLTITPVQLINQTSVINSIGFPSYVAGRTYSWIIKFQKFVKVVFTHVFLHIYESTECKDVIRFSRDMSKATKQSRVIDHRLNENEIQLETEEKQLVITFDSCTPFSRMLIHGSGFQALTTQQDKQSCFQLESTIDWSEGRSEFCEETTMVLTSMTFLGFPFRQTMETWTINVPQQQIHLYILEFQVSCKTDKGGSVFNVTDAAFEETYCNTNRPPDEIVSASDTFIVEFFKGEDTHIMYVEGFRASYSSNAPSEKSEIDYETSQSTVKNVAVGKPSVISSIYLKPARGANDGVIHQDTWLQTCFDTDLEFEPWWLVDLEDIYVLDRVVIYNRHDCSECARRSENLEVWVGLSLTSMSLTGFHCGVLKASKIFPQRSVKAKYVQVQTRNKKTYMNLCEIEVYGVFDSKTDSKVKTAFKKPKPVHGNWGSWGEWSDVCSNTKQQRRKRFCSNPAPNFGGGFCVGNDISTRTCISTGNFEENLLDNVNMTFSSRVDRDFLCIYTLVQDYPWVVIDLLDTYHLDQLTFANHKGVKNLIILTGETLCYMREQYFTKCGGAVTDGIDLTGITARYIKLQVLEEARSLQLCQLRLSGVKANFTGQNNTDLECETTLKTISSVQGDVSKREWSSWSTCSAVCGKGTQQRTRVCSNNNTDSIGASCEQTDTEYRSCGNHESCLVCSEKYNKCYNIIPELTNWRHAGYECWRKHMMLVSINSADELDFVKSLLRNESKYAADHPSLVLPGIDGDVTYFAHIGVYRLQTGQRIQDYTENKKPVVFSAWKPGEPSSGNCTKMNFQIPNQNSTWESEDCDTGLAEFYVCEISFETYKTYGTPNARFSKYSDDWHLYPDQHIKTTEYTGTVNMTDKNTACILWKDATKRKKESVVWWHEYFQLRVQANNESAEENKYHDFPDGSIASAVNYCRDPGNEGFLWCFTEDSFETCTVTLPAAPNSSSVYHYRGNKNTTYTGKTCQQWNTSFPHVQTFLEYDHHGEPVSEKRNYCRDPWNNGYLWCYTTDINTRWEPCFVKEPVSGRCSGVLTKYNGTLDKTVSGKKCEKWNKQMMLNEADENDVGSLLENYCRDPFNDGFIWCYTNLKKSEREICILEGVNAFNERTENTDATFKCSNGRLIKKDNKCDRKIDCIDLSDETNCQKTVKNHTLVEDLFLNDTDKELSMGESYFLCGSKEWISLFAKCDGVIDCLDASDEVGCIKKRECLEKDEYRCNNGECIHISQVCDFIEDCTDASDEYCELGHCANDQYRCKNGQCISAEQRCDAFVNCVDGSDEQICDKCNEDSAFHCDIVRCIPKRLVCDKYTDCSDRSDEILCTEETFSSCKDRWEAGYRETGSYVIDGMDVICNFTSVSENGVISTVFKNMDILWYSDTRTGNMFIRTSKRESDLNFVEKFATGNCTQEVRQSCIHVQKSIQSYLEQQNITDNQECSCAIQRITGISNTTNMTCTYNPYNGSGLAFNYEFSEYIRSVKLLSNHTKYYQIEVGNLTCTTRFNQSKEGITCKNDVKVIPNELRCVYDTDAAGFMQGCRSRSHLQDCEQFLCPPATVQCPGSYCIPIKYICDGNIECPGGEDEQMCGCSETEKEIVIIVYKDFYSSHRTVVQEFAKQFYNPVSIVRILIYEAVSPPTDLSLSKEQLLLKLHLLNVQDIQIQPFDVLHRLEDCEYKVTADNFINSIRFTKTSSNGIIFIDSNNSSKENAAHEILTKSRQNIAIYRVVERPDVIPVMDVYPNVSDVVVRRWKSLSHIGSEYFSKLCIVASILHIPNSYKCSSSKVFIPTFEVCDGIAQCFHGDDERLCQFNCPSNCTCKGYAVTCTGVDLTMTNITSIPKETRLLDLSMNKRLKEITNDANLRMTALIRLNLSYCDIENISLVAFINTKYLLTLDLSYNRIKTLRMSTFEILTDLTDLSLAGNFELAVIDAGAFKGLKKIHELDLARGKFTKISANTFSGLILHHLDLSRGRLREIEPLAFNELTVEIIDFTDNDVTNFHQDIFKGVMKLKKLRTPAYKFCCVKPNYMNEEDCLPFKDEFSSCEDLMRLPALQTMLWFIGLTAFFGNALTIVYRLKFDKERRRMPFGIFVTNLAAADFLMSVYLIIIAIADATFRKRYIVVDDAWRNSAICSFAGILSTMSSEASILFICLITLDRLLVARYPFGEVRFDTMRACASALFAWLFSFFVAVLPVVYESYFQNKFYSKSGVCIALPLTRERPPGWTYSVAIFVGLNFGTFILVAIGQWMIFAEIRMNKYVKNMSRNRIKDLKIARNLLFVVATDFLCWFPIGVMGMMALNGHVISGDVYAWSAVFILPVNSALNPILYTVTAIVGKKKFVPSQDEQNRYGGSSILNSEILCTHGLLLCKVGRYFSDSKTQAGDYISIGSVMDKNISIDLTTIVKLSFRIVKCLDVLHGGFLVVGNISRDTVFVDVSNNKVIGNIQICGEPSIQKRPGDSRDDMYKVGILIDCMCRKK